MGDPARIKQFLQFQGEFMGYLLAMTRDLDAAEDVFQNAAVVVLEQPMDDGIRDFRAWAKEVIRRQALKHLDEKRRALPTAEPQLLEQITRAFMEDATPQERVKEEFEALRACLDGVPGKSRAMFDLRYRKKVSFEEIARQLATTSAAAQRALSRLRKSLYDCVRQRLQTAEEGAP